MGSKWECLTIDEALALLRDPQFSVGCDTFFLARDLRALDESHVIPREQVKELLCTFVDYWGVLPPMTRHAGVLEQETVRSQRRAGDAILGGQWGLVPIFPGTTDSELGAVVRRIRRQIGKEYAGRDDARDGFADWLDLNGFPHALIAKAVYGRRQTAKERRQREQKRMRLEGRAPFAPFSRAGGALSDGPPESHEESRRSGVEGCCNGTGADRPLPLTIPPSGARARQSRCSGHHGPLASRLCPPNRPPLPGPLNGVLVAIPLQLIEALDNFRLSLLK